jgi:hypothetical protein
MRPDKRKRLDPDLVRAAHALIETYGPGAVEIAERRAANLGIAGGPLDAGAVAWRRIAYAVRTLQHPARLRAAA